VIVLPESVICEKCGNVFYVGNELRLPEDFIQQNDGQCPKCGKKLTFNPEKVEIKIVEE
jgi:predicted nucleic-acid-binding Zn-ribbon protein